MGKKTMYKIDGKEYKFSKTAFNDVINDTFLVVQKEHKPDKYTKGEFFESIGEKCFLSPESIRQYCKTKTGSSPADTEAVMNLAEALNCSVYDFLEECVQEAEVTTDMLQYTKEEKELVTRVFNELISNVDSIAKHKTIGVRAVSKWLKDTKSVDEVFKELVCTMHQNSLTVRDEVIERLNRILTELIDFTAMSAGWIPYRWENFTEWYLDELQCYLSDGGYPPIGIESKAEDIQKPTLYSYLKEKYPDVDEDYDFWKLYDDEVLLKLYIIELSSLIRQVFLADFSEMFEES